MKNQKKIALTPNAKVVLEKRYLKKDDTSNEVSESPEQMFARVAACVASVEGKSKKKWEAKYLDLLFSLRFVPNSPTLMNAGKSGGQLSACFVLPVEDTLEGIFDTLKDAALIHQSGGGTGFSFSKLRSRGSHVKSSQGVASGPVSFIRVFDHATDAIKQGGTRRGANMAVLRVDHPDIEEFIDSKRDLKSVTNFNISVGATANFMEAARANREFSLVDPHSGVAVRKVRAAELFEKICQAAWETGDPGLVFLDRVNFFNPTPKVGEMESTNPCGEQPLLPFESCNLGSLNLASYAQGGRFDWDLFCSDIRLATRFLDAVIDANAFPLKECEKITRRNRKIGLGVMGFADLLLLLGIRYDSDQAECLGEQIMSVLDREAKAESVRLAREKGAFANWKGSLWDRLGYPKMRNATVSTVAPTGTISMIAGCSSGIEPIFSGIYFRNVLSGERLREVHPSVEQVARKKGIDPERMDESELGRLLGSAWCPASDVPVSRHVRVQAAFQRHSDSAVSKTINLPKNATVRDVTQAYFLAYQQGCKGITIYRDQSRGTQVLERPEPKAKPISQQFVCEECD